jgi:hypothetical protein
MPRGYRGVLAALAGLVIALIVAASAIGFGLSKQAEYEWHSQEQSAEHARYTEQNIRNSCLSLKALAKADCINERRNTQRAYERDEQDLVAQKVTATWTGLMGGAAIIGMMLSAVGVWLVKTTFDESRKANEIARQSHIAQTRAWLVVEALEIEWRYRFNEGQIEVFGDVWFIIKNTGRSAANEIWTRSAVGDPNDIWPATWRADQCPLGPECLPPEGTTRVDNGFFVSIPLKSEGNSLQPQAACIQVTYNGGGVNNFVTECILTISSWETDANLGWNGACFGSYFGKSISLDAYAHFGYFRTVT